MSSRALALILARAGSKGLPGKNLRPVAGRACVSWTIDDAIAARESGHVARIAISTDCEGLQRLGVELGLDIVARPAELASDTATVDDAARHAVRALGDEAIGTIVVLYANVPVRPQRLIARAIDLLRETRADSVQSYEPVGKHHPWWTVVVGEREGGDVRPWEGDVLNHGVFRRQDLPPAHIPDGGVLAVTRRALMLEIPGVQPGPHAFFGKDRRGIINPIGSVIDIDHEIDAIVAETILSRRARDMQANEPTRGAA
ncbi:MAG TPA: acylneuraminate cytidylyltransferase family protein [Phycisphaerales bacterium]|nr:acylneuraminate cytidylyltransferase family protein [Phycisphaerales bacterium]